MSSIAPARRRTKTAQVLQTVEDFVRSQVPSYRKEEIERYLRLFGYNPDHSILQVHVAGYFGRASITPRQRAQRERAASRYRGRTFTVVGASHDPNLYARLISPRKKTDASNPGYLGYLFKPINKQNLAPHELLPLDFTLELELSERLEVNVRNSRLFSNNARPF